MDIFTTTKDEDNLKLLSALCEISNMCIGDITMGYKLDANHIGELIYEATGKTNSELNALFK